VTVIGSSHDELTRLHARCGPHHFLGRVLDVSAAGEGELQALVAECGDVVLSLLPAPLHPRVARACLAAGRHLVTSSYVSPELGALDAEARAKGLVFLNEAGLDPGCVCLCGWVGGWVGVLVCVCLCVGDWFGMVDGSWGDGVDGWGGDALNTHRTHLENRRMDHLSAMRLLDDCRARGGVVRRYVIIEKLMTIYTHQAPFSKSSNSTDPYPQTPEPISPPKKTQNSFRSVCGGLPAPEAAARNPFLYKFSWSPRAVLAAAEVRGRACVHGWGVGLWT
jgi:hypothetical protein